MVVYSIMGCSDKGRVDAASIETWCREAAAGESAALERLLWAYRGRLVSFAGRKVGPEWRGKIDVEDVLQEAYIHIFRDIAGFTYQDEDSFYRWASRIIDHAFIDHVRRLRRKKRDTAREIEAAGRFTSRYASFLDRHIRDTTTPSRIIRRNDAVNALMTCIARLPEHYRIVVRRHYLDEEPLAAIAADMNRSEDAVRRLSSRAVERLRVCLRSASHYLSSHDY